jgi:protein phosphatase 1 regulatory subunit 7
MEKRLTDLASIEKAAIASILDAGDDVIVQFSKPVYSRGLLRKIDSLCALHGERVVVRFFGHYSDPFDFACLRDLPAVKVLTIDCLQDALNVDVLWTLQHLTRLHLGIYNLDRPDILEGENLRSLTALSLGETRKRNVDLTSLAAMRHLEDVFIAGHATGLETLTELPALHRLTLSMLAKSVGLGFVGDLDQLRHLKLILGGRDSIAEVQHPQLSSLEVIRVRGLSELTPASFPRLQDLLIEDQIRLGSLEFSSANNELRRIRLINCKGLKSVLGLGKLSTLTELRIARTALRFEDLLAAGLPPALQIMAFYTGKAGPDREIRKQLDERGFS